MNLPRKAKILLVSLAIAGLAVPLLMVSIGIVLGANTLGPGCFGFFPILFVPLLLRSLFSRRAMGTFVITDDAIELRGSHATVMYRERDGWSVGALRRDVGSPHHWLLDLHRRAEGQGSRTEIPIDARIDDPRAVEAAARRALSPGAPAPQA
jgi:hypothetical protein